MTTCWQRSVCWPSVVPLQRRPWHVACRSAPKPARADQRLPDPLPFTGVATGGPDRDREQRAARSASRQQWAEVRAARRTMAPEPQIATGPSNFKPGQVPYGVDLAAAWAWRFVAICLATAIILWLLNLFLVVVLPLVIALFIAALVDPGPGLAAANRPPAQARRPADRDLRGRVHRPDGDLRRQPGLVRGSGTSPSRSPTASSRSATGCARDRSTSPTPRSAKAWTRPRTQIAKLGDDVVGRLSEVGTAVGHVVAGFFIVLFATYFFLADGAGHLGLAGAAVPAGRAPAGRLLGSGRLGVADPVRPRDRPGGGGRRDRHHDLVPRCSACRS